MEVKFKTVEAPIETRTGTGNREMDAVEITYPDGKVVAFPATDISPETGKRYCDMWPAKYSAFKNGEPDSDRVDQLNREIDERKAELDALHRGGADKADKRVQDNLGYSKEQQGDRSNKAALKTKDKPATKDKAHA